MSQALRPEYTAGAIFLGLDGIRHLVERGELTPERTLAMVTDLLALVVLGGGVIALAVRLAVARPESPFSPRSLTTALVPPVAVRG